MLKRPLLIATCVAALLMPAAVADAARGITAAQAKRAIKAKANKLAGQSTKVTTLLSLGPGKFYGQASWTKVDPAGCKGCDYDPVTGATSDTATSTPCWAGYNVSRSKKTGKVVATLKDQMCP